MENYINFTDGLSFKNSILEYEYDDEIKEVDILKYSNDVNFTDNELIKFINLDSYSSENKGNSMSSISNYSDFHHKLKKKMFDIEDNKVKKLILQKGCGNVVPANSIVFLKYCGYFEGEKEPFDSCHINKCSKIHIGDEGNTILGLQLGIHTMKLHEISVFWIHSDYGFGDYGCLPLIPPKANTIFIVQLIDYRDSNPLETITHDGCQKLSEIEQILKNLSKMAAIDFKNNMLDRAIRKYKSAINILEDVGVDNDKDEFRREKLLSRLLDNLVICYNMQDDPRHACIAAEKIQFRNAKTYFNHGKALLKMGEYEQARQKLKIALKFNPDSEKIKNELELVNDIYWQYIKFLNKNNFNSKPNNNNLLIYEEFAKNYCLEFIKNSFVLRQPLPENMSPDLKDMISTHAASMGINCTILDKYNNKKYYLHKSNYK